MDPTRLPDPSYYAEASEGGPHAASASANPFNFALGRGRGGLQDFARANPAAMAALGAGIMSGDMAGGLARFGQYAQAYRDRNATLDWLRRAHPAYAELAEAGMPIGEVWKRVLADGGQTAPAYADAAEGGQAADEGAATHAGADGEAVFTPTRREEIATLPSGALFVHPDDGEIYRVP